MKEYVVLFGTFVVAGAGFTVGCALIEGAVDKIHVAKERHTAKKNMEKLNRIKKEAGIEIN